MVYLDGLWQSENYFKDVADRIREDLHITAPTDPANTSMAEMIRSRNAVAIHVRWFDGPESCNQASYNISSDYYRHAIAFIEESVTLPHYFLFSDDPVAAHAKIALPTDRATFVDHNHGEENAPIDLSAYDPVQSFYHCQQHL